MAYAQTRRPRRPRRDHCGHLTNKPMNDATYAERRKVMAWVYRAKDLLRSVGIEMPRVQIRICEKDRHTLGVASLGTKAIWIAQSAIDQGDIKLGETVLHELAHTLFKAPHVEGCRLMHPYSHCCTDIKACERIFVQLAKAYHL